MYIILINTRIDPIYIYVPWLNIRSIVIDISVYSYIDIRHSTNTVITVDIVVLVSIEYTV